MLYAMKNEYIHEIRFINNWYIVIYRQFLNILELKSRIRALKAGLFVQIIIFIIQIFNQ